MSVESLLIIFELLVLVMMAGIASLIATRLNRLNKRVGAMEDKQEARPKIEPIIISGPEVDLMRFAESRGLTKRETEVLGYLIKGRNADYVAKKMFVTKNTVRTHIYNIYSKLDVHSQQELMTYFHV